LAILKLLLTSTQGIPETTMKFRPTTGRELVLGRTNSSTRRFRLCRPAAGFLGLGLRGGFGARREAAIETFGGVAHSGADALSRMFSPSNCPTLNF